MDWLAEISEDEIAKERDNIAQTKTIQTGVSHYLYVVRPIEMEPNVYKIAFTNYHTSNQIESLKYTYKMPFELISINKYVSTYSLEKAVHKELKAYKFPYKNHKEFFQTNLEVIQEAINKLIANTPRLTTKEESKITLEDIKQSILYKRIDSIEAFSGKDTKEGSTISKLLDRIAELEIVKYDQKMASKIANFSF